MNHPRTTDRLRDAADHLLQARLLVQCVQHDTAAADQGIRNTLSNASLTIADAQRKLRYASDTMAVNEPEDAA